MEKIWLKIFDIYIRFIYKYQNLNDTKKIFHTKILKFKKIYIMIYIYSNLLTFEIHVIFWKHLNILYINIKYY